MIPTIESGITGFDKLTISKSNIGGIQERSTTLVYGPPKTGKSIFCNQFAYHGLLNGNACLYVTLDHGLKQLKSNMINFEWYIQNYIQNQTLYIIDGISQLSGAKLENTNNIKSSSFGNPADIMVKVGIGSRFVYKKSKNFISILDSLNTMFAFNPNQMVIRVLKAYLRRISEAGGTVLIAYTESVADPETEKELLTLFDNTIRLDGDSILIKSHNPENLIDKFESPYTITNKGIVINKKNPFNELNEKQPLNLGK